MLDISKLLEKIKKSPYEEITVLTQHSGVLSFADLKEGDRVYGRSGAWQEKPGTVLAVLERERNKINVECQDKGEIKQLYRELDGKFVEAATPVAVIRHFLSYNALRVYDRIGYGALIVVIFILPMIGFDIIGALIMPFMAFFQGLLGLFLGFR